MTALEKVSNDVESKLKNIIQEYLDSLDRETEKKFHSDYETFEEVADAIYEKIFDNDVQDVLTGEDDSVLYDLPFGVVNNALDEFGYDFSSFNNLQSCILSIVRVYLATQMLNDVLNEFV